MVKFRFPGADEDPPHDWEPIPFPRPPESGDRDEGIAGRIGGGTADDVLEALDEASRRMEDLARALGCLGADDDDDDPPRAA